MAKIFPCKVMNKPENQYGYLARPNSLLDSKVGSKSRSGFLLEPKIGFELPNLFFEWKTPDNQIIGYSFATAY